MLRVASCRKDAASCCSFACCAGMVPACVSHAACRASCSMRCACRCSLLRAATVVGCYPYPAAARRSSQWRSPTPQPRYVWQGEADRARRWSGAAVRSLVAWWRCPVGLSSSRAAASHALRRCAILVADICACCISTVHGVRCTWHGV